MINDTIMIDGFNSTKPPPVTSEGGVFSGKGLLDSPLALFLVQACIIISLSRFIHWVLHKTRQPQVIAEIIGGICLGPSVLGQIPGFTETLFPKHSLPVLSLAASFGLVLYMFLMGLELDTGMLVKGIKRFLIIAVAGIILPGVLGAMVSFGLYEFLLDEHIRAKTPFLSFLLFTFASFAITAFPVLARILTEKKLLSTTVGLMTISASAVGDIFAWILLALVISIINAGNPFTAVYVLIACAVYAVILLVPVRILVKKIFEKFLGHKNHILSQFVLAMIVMAIFLSAWTTEWIGVHAIFGAFLVGIIIPRIGGITMELTHKFEDLVGVVFLPLYFASSGLKTKLGLLNDWDTLLFLIISVIAACAGKIIACMVAAKFTGFNWRESFSIGVLMNTKGLVELIVLNIGIDSHVINDKIFVVLVLTALVTTFMTSPIIAWVYPPKYHAQVQPVPLKKKVKHMALHWPTIDDRILLYLKDFDSVKQVSNILQMFKNSLPEGKNMFLYGLKVFTDFERSSNIMVSTQTEHVIETDPTLRMFQFFGEMINSMTKCFVANSRLVEIGHEINRIATQEQSDFVVVPWIKDAPGVDQLLATISIINEVKTPVTIFIDRRIPGSSHGAQPFYGIVVPFIGSSNEREALKLAFRFHKAPNVKLTVLHLQIDGQPTYQVDKDLLTSAKKLSKDGSGTVTIEEIKIENNNLDILVEKLRESTFDLVILGHSTRLRSKSIFSMAQDSIMPGQKRTSLIRRFSQRHNEMSDDEKIFGSIGETLYNSKGIPSMLIVHEPTTSVTNGSHAA